MEWIIRFACLSAGAVIGFIAAAMLAAAKDFDEINGGTSRSSFDEREIFNENAGARLKKFTRASIVIFLVALLASCAPTRYWSGGPCKENKDIVGTGAFPFHR